MNDRYVAVGGIRMVDFGEEWVVFNPVSWDAHVLNAAAAIVLESMVAGPSCVSDVESCLRELLVDDERESAAQHAQRLLDGLVQLGLVRAVVGEPATNC